MLSTLRRSTHLRSLPSDGLNWSTVSAATTTGIFCRQQGRVIAHWRFLVPSLADYEAYRGHFGVHAELIEADRIRDESGCVLRYDRTFMRPLLKNE
jgi:hypothetical protein